MTKTQATLLNELKLRGLATRTSGSGFYSPLFGVFSQKSARRQIALYDARQAR